MLFGFLLLIAMGCVGIWHDVSTALAKRRPLQITDSTPRCRQCEVGLADPLFRNAIGHGAYLCDDCNEVIELEVGLRYPDWWNESDKAPPKAIPPPQHYLCGFCKVEHEEGYICLKDMARYIPTPDPPFQPVGGNGGTGIVELVKALEDTPRGPVVAVLPGVCEWCLALVPAQWDGKIPSLCNDCIVNGHPWRARLRGLNRP